MNRSVSKRIDELIERLVRLYSSGKTTIYELEVIRQDIYMLVKDTALNADRFLKLNEIVEGSLSRGSFSSAHSWTDFHAMSSIERQTVKSSQITTTFKWSAFGVNSEGELIPDIDMYRVFYQGDMIRGAFMYAVDGVDIPPERKEDIQH